MPKFKNATFWVSFNFLNQHQKLDHVSKNTPIIFFARHPNRQSSPLYRKAMIHPIFTYVLTTAKKNSSAGAAAKLWPLSTFTLLPPAVFLQCCYIHVAINQCCLLWHFLSALCLCMSNFPTCRLTICPHFNIKRVEKFQQKLRSTLFENHPQYPLGISHLWHFPPIFVLLKSSCIQICSRCWMRLFYDYPTP